MDSRLALLLGIAVTLVSMAPANAQTAATRKSSSPTTGTPTAATGLTSDVVFTQYSPLADIAELVRRTLTPLNALRLTQEAARNGKTLRGQPIDLSRERFSVYVPALADPTTHRYSLLVFVPPWSKADLPPQWIRALDQHGMIFVTAANSGNDTSVIDRREPLALLAAHNVMVQYPVDPQRVFIGGFSGGSRVALRLALGYPDVFHGALLNAGSDPLGNSDLPLPSAELFARFQESTRLVYVTGERDDAHLVDDMQSRRSLEKWCVFDVVTENEPRVAHEPADASAFSRSLEALLAPTPPHPGKLAECRARVERELAAQLKQVEDTLAHGDPDAARRLLEKVDGRYGGLAAPRSVELAGTIR